MAAHPAIEIRNQRLKPLLVLSYPVHHLGFAHLDVKLAGGSLQDLHRQKVSGAVLGKGLRKICGSFLGPRLYTNHLAGNLEMGV